MRPALLHPRKASPFAPIRDSENSHRPPRFRRPVIEFIIRGRLIYIVVDYLRTNAHSGHGMNAHSGHLSGKEPIENIMSSVKIDNLTMNIYNSAIEPDHRISIIIEMQRILNSKAIFLFDNFAINVEDGHAWSNYNIDKSTYYANINNHVPNLNEYDIGEIFEFDGYFAIRNEENPKKEFAAREDEHLFENIVGAILAKHDEITFHIASYGPKVTKNENDKRKRILKDIAPHFMQAIKIVENREILQQECARLSEALNRIEIGVLILDERMRILSTNTTSERILEQNDGLSASGGYLTTTSMNGTRDLVRLVRQAAAGLEGQSANGAIRLARQSELRPYNVVVAPNRHEYTLYGSRKGTVIIFVTDPENPAHAGPSVYRQLFGLTVSESNVAASLSAGMTIKQIAEALGLSTETVRGYVKRVFGKTQTNSQAQLVYLLTSIADPRKPVSCLS